MKPLSSEGCLDGGRGHLRGSRGQEFPAAEDVMQSWWVASCRGSVAAMVGAPHVEELLAFLTGGSCCLLSLGFWPSVPLSFSFSSSSPFGYVKTVVSSSRAFIYSFFATPGSLVRPPLAVILC